MIYFSSDRHLSHKNVLIFDRKRGEQFIDCDDSIYDKWLSGAETEKQKSLDRDPYRKCMKESIQKHNEYILGEIRKLKKTDELYFLGDLFFLNGKKEILKIKEELMDVDCRMYWIRGNHDDDKHIKYLGDCFERVKDYYELRNNGNIFCLMHYPIQSWRSRYKSNSYHLNGHSHQNLSRKVKGAREWLLKLFGMYELYKPKNRFDISYDGGKLLYTIDDILGLEK